MGLNHLRCNFTTRLQIVQLVTLKNRSCCAVCSRLRSSLSSRSFFCASVSSWSSVGGTGDGLRAGLALVPAACLLDGGGLSSLFLATLLALLVALVLVHQVISTGMSMAPVFQSTEAGSGSDARFQRRRRRGVNSTCFQMFVLRFK